MSTDKKDTRRDYGRRDALKILGGALLGEAVAVGVMLPGILKECDPVSNSDRAKNISKTIKGRDAFSSSDDASLNEHMHSIKWIIANDATKHLEDFQYKVAGSNKPASLLNFPIPTSSDMIFTSHATITNAATLDVIIGARSAKEVGSNADSSLDMSDLVQHYVSMGAVPTQQTLDLISDRVSEDNRKLTAAQDTKDQKLIAYWKKDIEITEKVRGMLAPLVGRTNHADSVISTQASGKIVR